MSIAPSNFQWNDGGGTNTGTLSWNAMSAGTMIEMAVWFSRARTISTVTDNNSNTWVLNGSIYDDGAIYKYGVYRVESANANAGFTTVTVDWGASCADFLFVGCQITGQAASPYDQIQHQTQGAPGTGADGVTTGNTGTLAQQPALIMGYSFASTNNTSLAAGTGYTSGSTGTSRYSSHFRAEWKRVTATTAVAATFTAGANVNHDSLVSVYKELVAATTQGLTMVSNNGGF